MTADDAVAGIAATITAQGLKCHPVRDDNDYPAAVKVSGRQMRHLEEHAVVRHGPHPDWNYTILPAPAQEPDPEPAGPDPALPAALAALAGIPDFGALLAGIDVAWQADREHRLALTRGHARIKNSGGPRKLAPATVIAAAACRIRLGMTWTLLGQILGVRSTSISVPAGPAIPILHEHGITAAPGAPRIKTAAAFRDHAAALGITINGITSQDTANKDTGTTRPKSTTK